MRNLLIYYLAILLPLGFLFWLIKSHSEYMLYFLLFYVFIYRTYTDGVRLFEKNILPKNKIWKMIIPGFRFNYFRELYLK